MDVAPYPISGLDWGYAKSTFGANNSTDDNDYCHQ